MSHFTYTTRYPAHWQKVSACFACHDVVDHIGIVRRKKKAKMLKRQARVERHRALGIGTGLVLVETIRSEGRV